jgi:hypothetical protein
MEANHGRIYQGITASDNSRVVMGDVGGDVHMYGNEGRLLGVSMTANSVMVKLGNPNIRG